MPAFEWRLPALLFHAAHGSRWPASAQPDCAEEGTGATAVKIMVSDSWRSPRQCIFVYLPFTIEFTEI